MSADVARAASHVAFWLAAASWLVGAVAAIGCAAVGESPEEPARPADVPWLVEQSAARGLDFRHRSGHDGPYYLPEAVSGGGGLFDMDGDGDLDAYLVQSGSLTDPNARRPGNQLYENLGDGTFRAVADPGDAADEGYGLGVACGDFDEDGDTDLYVTNAGRNTLLRNDGAGRFADVTDAAGVGHVGFGSSAGFLDYDADGDLDLFVVNYVHWSREREIECYNGFGETDYCSPLNYRAPAMDTLYRNEGGGRFVDVTREVGMDVGFGNGLGFVAGDFDGDGRLDVFVANDGLVDQLWVRPTERVRFRDDALVAGCAVDMEGGVPKAGMGVTAGDLDEDGDLDLMVCNLMNESDSVYRNEGRHFTDITASAGLASISRGFTRFGMGWIDLDNDGLLDLYQGNGRVKRLSPKYGDDPYAEPNLLFRGLPGARFAEVEPRGGTDPPLFAATRAVAFGDVDGDGGIDLLVVNRDAPAHLLMNRVPRRGAWVRFRVLERSGRDAEGATLLLRVGRRNLRRDVRVAFSYLACNDPRVHVGLGDASRVDEVVVRWVDGERERFGPFAAGAEATLRRGAGERLAGPGGSSP